MPLLRRPRPVTLHTRSRNSAVARGCRPSLAEVSLLRQRRLPGGSHRRAVVARVEVHSLGMRKAAGSTPAGGSTGTSSIDGDAPGLYPG